MADLPQIWARPNVPFQQLPGVASAAQGFTTLAQVAGVMAERQAVIDVSRAAAEYDLKVEDLKTKYLGQDPNTRRESFIKDEAELRKLFPEGRAGALLHHHADSRYANNVATVTAQAIKDSHFKQLGDIEVQGNINAKAAGETEDPSVRQTLTNNYNAMVTAAATPSKIGERTVPAALTPEKAEEKKQKFQTDILLNRSAYLSAKFPYKLRDEINKGVYDSLDLDNQAKVMERQRIGINNLEATVDKNAGKIHEMMINEAYSKAAGGFLSDTFLRAVIANEVAYLTPQQGLRLKELNDNPVTGEGSDQVKAITSEYHSKRITDKNINDTRASLNALRGGSNKPNPLIDKALRQLQIDQNSLENMDAARFNRESQRAHDLYDSKMKSILPALRNVMPNTATRDKGEIDTIIHNGGDVDAAIERMTNGHKTKVENDPQWKKETRDYITKQRR